MKIIISGALGHMGRELAQAASSAGISIACGVDPAYNGQVFDFPMVCSYDQIVEKADVLIDFSITANLDNILAYAIKERMPLILCVTGYSQEQIHSIEEASKQVSILRSANMSFGVQVLSQLAKIAVRALGTDFDIEIIEKHHNRKVDSPSGTALMLADTIGQERENLKPVYGRYGKSSERSKNEIGIHAVRGGTVSGEHEVGFYGDGEELIITHRAENRALFARGALRGAAFIIGQPPGLYSLADAVSRYL